MPTRWRWVVYEQGGRLFNVRAGQVVMASGGWVNKHLLVDMPEDLRTAYGQFGYAPALIVNVALRQRRFLYELDITACRWFDDTDQLGLLQPPPKHGDRPARATLHPDKPAVLSFYLGLPVPGLPAATQGMAARARLMNTTYIDFELLIRRQMLRLFGASGFKPKHDIAAIALNRWVTHV